MESSSSSNLSGWELLRNSVRADITKDADHIVAFVHWFLVHRAQLGCLGNGNDVNLLDSDVSSELMPADWNIIPKSYALRYQLLDKVYVLMGTIHDENIVLQLLSCARLEGSSVQFHTATTADTIQSASRTAVQPEVQAILDRVRTELVDAVFEPNRKAAETQTTNTAATTAATATNYEERNNPSGVSYPSLLQERRPRPQIGVGSRDLHPFPQSFSDPFGGDGGGFGGGFGGGGGMLYNPPMRPDAQPDIPGHMPGARFDPMGPFGPRRPQNPRHPGNDHFQPPGFDGFM